MNNPQSTPDQAPLDDAVRPHVFDEIQEYDKRLPNWWLFTLYSSIAFSIGYWVYVEKFEAIPPGAIAVGQQMDANKAAATQKSGELNDDVLWTMSRDASITAPGKVTFDATCASCHRPDLMGMIGPNLRDHQWVHGESPMTIIKTIDEGVLAKGMPPWAAVLGKKKIMEVTAYILSYHKQGEPAEIAPWVPTMGAPAGTVPPPPSPAPAQAAQPGS